jgi:hypothetical protein
MKNYLYLIVCRNASRSESVVNDVKSNFDTVERANRKAMISYKVFTVKVVEESSHHSTYSVWSIHNVN